MIRQIVTASLPRLLPGLVEAAQRAAVSEFPRPVERDDARDAALLAAIAHVPRLGWSHRALIAGADQDADLLFPGGGVEMVEAHSDLADRRLEAAAAEITETGLSRRVKALVLLRLRQAEGEREAIRRGLALLMLPGNRPAALRSVARTVDVIWHVAGDRSVDASWYSKRAILAGVYSATLLFWIRRDGDLEATEGFLDRQLHAVAGLGRARAGVTSRLRAPLDYAASRASTCSGAMRTSAS